MSLRRPASSGSSSLRNAGLSSIRAHQPTVDVPVVSSTAGRRPVSSLDGEDRSISSSTSAYNQPISPERVTRRLVSSQSLETVGVDTGVGRRRGGAGVVGRLVHSPLRMRPENPLPTPAIAQNPPNSSDGSTEGATVDDVEAEERRTRLLRDLELIMSLDLQLEQLAKKASEVMLMRAELRNTQASADRLHLMELERDRMARMQRAKRGDVVDATSLLQKLQSVESKVDEDTKKDLEDQRSVASAATKGSMFSLPRSRFARSEMSTKKPPTVPQPTDDIDTSKPTLRKGPVSKLGWKPLPKPSIPMFPPPRIHSAPSRRDADAETSPPKSVVTGLSTLDDISVAASDLRGAETKDFISRNVELAGAYSISNRLAPSEEDRIAKLLQEDEADNRPLGSDAAEAGTGESSDNNRWMGDGGTVRTGYTTEGLDAEREKLLDGLLSKMVSDGTASEYAASVIHKKEPVHPASLKLLPSFLTELEEDDAKSIAAASTHLQAAGDPIILAEREKRLLQNRLRRVDQALMALQGIPGSDCGLSARTRDAASVVTGLSPPRASNKPFSTMSYVTGLTKDTRASTSSVHRRLTRADISAEIDRAKADVSKGNLASNEEIGALLAELRSSGLESSLSEVLEPSLHAIKWKKGGGGKDVLETIRDESSEDEDE